MVPSKVDAEVIAVVDANGPLAINDDARTRGANAMETAGVDKGDVGNVDAAADPRTTGALWVASGGAACAAAAGGARCDDDHG